MVDALSIMQQKSLELKELDNESGDRKVERDVKREEEPTILATFGNDRGQNLDSWTPDQLKVMYGATVAQVFFKQQHEWTDKGKIEAKYANIFRRAKYGIDHYGNKRLDLAGLLLGAFLEVNERCKRICTKGNYTFQLLEFDAREEALIELKTIKQKYHSVRNWEQYEYFTDNIFTMRQWCSKNFPQGKEQLEHLYNE
nr:hypothetical protein [Tanacetum cinerariifolium]